MLIGYIEKYNLFFLIFFSLLSLCPEIELLSLTRLVL